MYLRVFCRLFLCAAFPSIVASGQLSTSSSATSSTTPSVFQQQAETAVTGGKPIHSISLAADAEWAAGSTHASGTAQLQAKSDGSSTVQLSLGSASRTDAIGAAADARTCSWTDNKGTSHDITGGNCFVSIPWFAPNLFSQAASQLPSLLGVTDDGAISANGSSFHQMNFALSLQGMDTTHTQLLQKLSTVKVYYDPTTSLPSYLEYSAHPDGNDLQDIPIRVTFSNYQQVSGVMIPFHIEKYLNRSLLLTLNVTSATIE